jgi:hypothetical protein
VRILDYKWWENVMSRWNELTKCSLYSPEEFLGLNEVLFEDMKAKCPLYSPEEFLVLNEALFKDMKNES